MSSPVHGPPREDSSRNRGSPGDGARDWLEAEPPMSVRMIGELQRIKRRGKRHPVRILIVAALLTAGLTYQFANRPRIYNSTVILVVSEGDLLEDREPLPMRDLRDYVATVSFSRDNLLPLIRRVDPYPAEDLEEAERMVRKVVEIDVYRNYFTEPRGFESAPRTARIAITYYHLDAEQAYRMARSLANLVVESETARRQAGAARTASIYDLAIEARRQDIARREKIIVERELEEAAARREGDTARIAQLRVELRDLQLRLRTEKADLSRMSSERSRVQLSEAMESKQLGLGFRVADERIPEDLSGRSPVQIAVVALACFLIMTPGCALLFGAFDNRIHDDEDVTRLGLRTLGQVPAFAGDSVGSMKDRRRRRDRVT